MHAPWPLLALEVVKLGGLERVRVRESEIGDHLNTVRVEVYTTI